MVQTGLFVFDHSSYDESVLDDLLLVSQPTVFFCSQIKCGRDVPLIHAANIVGFNGLVIATCFKTAKFLVNLPIKHKFFLCSKSEDFGEANLNIRALSELNIVTDDERVFSLVDIHTITWERFLEYLRTNKQK